MKKKWIFSLIFAMMIMSQVSFAEYITLYEWRSEPEEIASGVMQQQIQRFTDGGWLNMNLIYVDLTQGSKLSVITDTKLSSRDTLSKLVSKSDEAASIVAAVNSDFFDTANNTTMGTLIKDGEVLTTSAGYNEFATLNVAKNGLPFVGYFNQPVNYITNGNQKVQLSYINKPYLNYNRIIMFDQNWSGQSYGSNIGQDIYEVLVVDGIVTEMRMNGTAFTIPENGYVLSAVGQGITTLKNAFKVSDTLTVDYDYIFDALDLAIGGGAQIVTNGQVPTTFSQNITGNNPRTAVGIDKARKKLILLTVDGRTTSYRGMTQTELAKLMISFGAFEAINLDGGGSTEMVVRDPWDTSLDIVNSPSDGSERKMYTGLAVVKQLIENPVLEKLNILTTKDRFALGENISFALQGLDSNFNVYNLDPALITWSATGVKGSLEGNVFKPAEAGTLTVTGHYMDLSISKEVEVFDDAVSLSVTPSVLKVDSAQNTTLKFSVQTNDGEQFNISAASVQVEVPQALGSYNQLTGVLTSGASGQGYITVTFNGLKTYVPMAIGTERQLLKDFESKTAHFIGYPSTVLGAYNELSTAKEGNLGGVLQYDFTTTTETRAAYITFDQTIALPTNTTGVGLWALGDGGNDHWLRGKLVDANGTTANITFAQHVDWTGWKYVTASIPATMVAPISLERVYLVETDVTKQDIGMIAIDNIYAIVSQPVTLALPANVTKIKAPETYVISDKLKNRISLGYLDNSSKEIEAQSDQKDVIGITQKGYSLNVQKGITMITLDNTGGNIRKNGYTQWTNLLNQVSTIGNTPVVVLMNDVNTYTDSLEKSLLLETLGKLSDSGKEVAIVYPIAGETYKITTNSGIKVIQIPKSVTAVHGMTFAANGKTLEFQILK